jgi:hypothetical protein
MAFDNIGLAEPSTITKVVASVTIARGSTTEHQEILCLGDVSSSLAVARVLGSAPPSTTFGLTVRIAGGPSSAVDLQMRPVFSSTGADNPVTATQSGAWNVGAASTQFAANAGFHFDSSGALQITNASTTVNVSSAAGRVAIAGYHQSGSIVNVTDSTNNAINVNVVAGAAAGSTNVTVSRTVGNSSAADYMPVRIVDSSGTGFLAPGLEYTDGSTTSTLAAPSLAYNNGTNATMRLVGLSQPLPVQLRVGANTFASTTAVINSSASTAVYSLISSAASLKQCVYAYSVTSTAVTPMSVEFMSSGASPVWSLDVGSASSGVTGANLAVNHPTRLFATAAGEALGVRLGSTGVNVRVSVSAFTE